MLTTVFFGSRNRFDQLLVHWLSTRTELAGVVWTTSAAWRHTWRGRLRFTRSRLRRCGPARTLDEIAFFLVFQRFLRDRDAAALERDVIDPYVAERGPMKWRGDQIRAAEVNDPRVLTFVRERSPDLILAMCTNDWFGKELRAAPRDGVFVWHEGITPEYRGLYPPFWAVRRLDFVRIGYTLLRMSDRLDAGDVYVQGRLDGVDPRRHGHLYLGHRAIWESLPAVERFLGALESGAAEPIDRSGAPDRLFTYPGLTDLVAQRWALRRAGRA